MLNAQFSLGRTASDDDDAQLGKDPPIKADTPPYLALWIGLNRALLRSLEHCVAEQAKRFKEKGDEREKRVGKKVGINSNWTGGEGMRVSEERESGSGSGQGTKLPNFSTGVTTSIHLRSTFIFLYNSATPPTFFLFFFSFPPSIILTNLTLYPYTPRSHIIAHHVWPCVSSILPLIAYLMPHTSQTPTTPPWLWS